MSGAFSIERSDKRSYIVFIYCLCYNKYYHSSFVNTDNCEHWSKKVKNELPLWVPVGLLVAFVLGWFGAGALVSDSNALDTAKGLGYTNIEVSDRSYAFPVFSGCAKGDMIKWRVSGTNPAGQHTEFTVCAGLFKEATPRF